MPQFNVDLHNHTPLLPRDYRGAPDTAPRQIVESALAKGLDVYAATDHFAVDFCDRLIAASEEVAAETGRRLLVVPGAELKVRHGGDEVHVVALLPPDRATRAFAELLGVLGLTAPVAPLEQLHHVHVEHDPREVFHIIEAVGGMGIIGHADRRFGDYRLFDSPFMDTLLSSPAVRAVELVDMRHAEALSGYGVNTLQSSDSHSLAEMGRRSSTLSMEERSFPALIEALSAPVALAV